MNKPKIQRFAIDGWLAFDKPLEMSSTQAVAKVKWLFKAEKAGHAGTLDPLASGVLPLALGEATKTVPYVLEDGQKSYRFTCAWGKETTTDDTQGEAVKTSDKRPKRSEIEALLPQFTGKIIQTPPQFSAIKIKGERAYDLARAGQVVDIQPREVEIESLTLIESNQESATFEILCGKGTYVRALARDMGRILGCYGHVTHLRRTRVGPFGEESCFTLPQLEAMFEAGTLMQALLPVQAGLEEVPEVLVNAQMAQSLKRGQSVLLRGAEIPQSAQLWASYQGKLVAICDYLEGRLEPRRVFS